MKAALYLRVSTDEQTVQNQRRELEAVAARHGWQIVAVSADEGISGAKSRRSRNFRRKAETWSFPGSSCLFVLDRQEELA